MAIAFKPLWKLRIDRDMTKQELRQGTGLSAATIAKMGKDGNITTKVLSRVCETLEVKIEDICEVIEKSSADSQKPSPEESVTQARERSEDGS